MGHTKENLSHTSNNKCKYVQKRVNCLPLFEQIIIIVSFADTSTSLTIAYTFASDAIQKAKKLWSLLNIHLPRRQRGIPSPNTRGRGKSTRCEFVVWTLEHRYKAVSIFRYVIECPRHGEIYRSRQFWYGNAEPDMKAVRSEIRHVWPDVS